MRLNSHLTSVPMNATATASIPSMPAPTEPHGPSSRPTLGFPLGTALLLLVVFCLSGVFSCCYHWDKLRRLRGRIPFLPPLDAPTGGGDDSDEHPPHADLPSPTAKTNQQLQGALQGKEFDSLPVIMPGGQIPTYIAWPCPCRPAAAPQPPPPLLPSPPIKIVAVDVLTTPTPARASSLALAPASPP